MWLGSQATKPVRIALALVLSPAADVALDATERRLGLPSRQRAFWVLFFAILGSTGMFITATVAFATARAVATAPVTSSVVSSAGVFLLSRLETGEDFEGRSGFEGCGKTGVSCLAVGSSKWRRGERAGRSRVMSSATGSTEQSDVTELGEPMPATTAAVHEDRNIGGRRTPTPVYRQPVRKDSGRDGRGPMYPSAAVQTEGNTIRENSGGGGRGPMYPSAAIRTVDRMTTSGTDVRRQRRISPQRAADLNPPRQKNIHSWNEQPKHFLGLWEIVSMKPLPPPDPARGPEAMAAAAPSMEAAAALAAAVAEIAAGSISARNKKSYHQIINSGEGEPRRTVDKGIEDGGNSHRPVAERVKLDFGSDILHHVKYVVFRRDGALRIGPAGIGACARSWRFAPPNKRIIFEVDVPGRGVTLR